jgi:hypothetical protein
VFEAVTEPARIYVDATSCPDPSRYVLYADGTFVLQYQSFTRGYRGTYREINGTVVFDWEDRSVAGPWGATGAITDSTVAVAYNFVMNMSGFDDAVYTRAQ